MAQPASSPDLDDRSWHDDALYGMRLDIGDVARGDWLSDLVLDIDHIVEWLCGADGQCRFRVAPATLAFHRVTDLRRWTEARILAGRRTRHVIGRGRPQGASAVASVQVIGGGVGVPALDRGSGRV
jgi:hypothetical protein